MIPSATRTESAGQTRLTRWFTPAVALAAILPLLVAAVYIMFWAPNLRFADDRAVFELGVRSAGRLEQLVGNGSRFGWRHPGPAWFYLMVAPYRLLGSNAAALTVGALLWHGAAVMGVVAVVRHFVGRFAAALAALACLGVMAGVGIRLFTDVWPPYLVILPLVLIAVLAAVGSSQREVLSALMGATVVGSVMVHLKIEMIVVVPTLLAAALVLRTLRFGVPFVRDEEWKRPVPLLLGGLVLLIWVPPIIDQLTGSGNLGRLIRFGSQGDTTGTSGYSLSTAIDAVGMALSIPPFRGRQIIVPEFEVFVLDAPWWAPLVFLAYLSAAIALVVLAWRRRQDLARNLAVLGAVLILISTVWVQNISREISFYLVVWMAAIPAILAIAGSMLLAWSATKDEDVLAKPTAVAGLLAVAIGVALAIPAWGTWHVNTVRSAEVAEMADLVESNVAVTDREVLVTLASADRWMETAGLLVELERAGAHIAVDDDWVFYFGDPYKQTQPAEVELWISDQNGAQHLRQLEGLEPIGSTEGDTWVFVR